MSPTTSLLPLKIKQLNSYLPKELAAFLTNFLLTNVDLNYLLKPVVWECRSAQDLHEVQPSLDLLILECRLVKLVHKESPGLLVVSGNLFIGLILVHNKDIDYVVIVGI